MGNAMTEFRITSDLSALRSQVIEANFDEVREWLDENLEPYRNMTVTEGDISTAKSYRANIRKVRGRIDESRKEAKTAALAAYTEFEQKCKLLTGLCDDAANSIDKQVKEFEEREKASKIDVLREFYQTHGDGEVFTYLPWDKVLNPRWANKGYALETAQSEILAAIDNVRQDIGTIRSIGGENTAYLLDYYKTHDLRAVTQKNIELNAAKKAEEQRKLEAEEHRREAEKAAQTAAAISESTPQKPEGAIDVDLGEEPVQLVEMKFKVVCTRDQLSALADFMRKNGIKYSRA